MSGKTTEEQRKQAMDLAKVVWPESVGSLVYRRIFALRVTASDSDRLNAEMDGLVVETLRQAEAP